jgi:hypothetical protein
MNPHEGPNGPHCTVAVWCSSQKACSQAVLHALLREVFRLSFALLFSALLFLALLFSTLLLKAELGRLCAAFVPRFLTPVQ